MVATTPLIDALVLWDELSASYRCFCLWFGYLGSHALWFLFLTRYDRYRCIAVLILFRHLSAFSSSVWGFSWILSASQSEKNEVFCSRSSSEISWYFDDHCPRAQLIKRCTPSPEIHFKTFTVYKKPHFKVLNHISCVPYRKLRI